MANVRKRIYEIIEVSRYSDNVGALYDTFMMVAIIASIIPLCFKMQNTALKSIDKITVTIFIIDYIVRWSTYDLKKPKLKQRAFLYYPFSFYAIIDLLSILPSITVVHSGLKLFRLFRLLRIFKAFKILRYSKSFRIITTVIRKEKTSLLSVGYLSIGYILVSALIMFSVEPTSFTTFFDAVYWATTALTTVGYGDIYPVTVIGKIVSMISSLLGIAVVALPAGIITAGYMHELNKES